MELKCDNCRETFVATKKTTKFCPYCCSTSLSIVVLEVAPVTPTSTAGDPEVGGFAFIGDSQFLQEADTTPVERAIDGPARKAAVDLNETFEVQKPRARAKKQA